VEAGGAVDIEEFYDENPKRRASEEFEFGRDWSDSDGDRCEVSWVKDTGELYVMGAPVEPIVADGAGDEFLQRLPTKSVVVSVLAVVPTREAVEQALAGWSDAMAEPNSIVWVRDRIAHRSDPASNDQRTVLPDDEPDELRGAGSSVQPRGSDPGSFMISSLIKQLRKKLPESERAKLAPYYDRAYQAGSDPTAEWHRAYRCAQWAEQIVSQPTHHHLTAEAERALEVVREVKKTIGSELLDLELLPLGQSVSPRFQAELTWVEEAARVAEKVAAKSGWEAVPWEQLLQDMLKIGPATGR
jgi:hypothetical protein